MDHPNVAFIQPGVLRSHTSVFISAYLTGKTSLVTGGNSGLGVETVKALATAGSRVILSSRSVEAGKKVAEQLRAEGVKASAPAHVLYIP